ncbi:hypothetical protein EXE48_11680 [Halorubrum sp. ASP1]|uniref:hypothetical protein n=1 Tax=Halorubrum sp. ASP1 TaxID=2518114 RepID=UPI0010F721C8|nr:hypothetical protein [Halorubrum sp. ASP1]TKX60625.1 hypothetical protein EXE48_11680 [Halorubrum sp. ASP1]
MSSNPKYSSEDTSSRTVDITVNTQLSDSIKATDLLKKAATIPFCGLTPVDNASPPEELSSRSSFYTDVNRSLKEALTVLPDAGSGELFAENQFVGNDGTPDVEKIRQQSGLDLEELSDFGVNLDQRATRDRGKLDTVESHQDIRDPRREALAALGFDVEYRWQIASDRYSIIQPSETLMRAIAALQRNGHTNVYGAISLRKWGGAADVFMFFPDLSVDLKSALSDPEDVEGLADAAKKAAAGEPKEEGERGFKTPDTDPDKLANNADQEVHLGLCANYSHTGGSVFRVSDIALIPEENAMFFTDGFEKRRRHDGNPNSVQHERKNDRVPLSDWWDDAISELKRRKSRLPELVSRARKTPINFSDAKYTVEEFYTHLGIPEEYAESAATVAQRLGMSPTVITMWPLYVGLGAVLTSDFGGKFASESHKGYYSTLNDILIKPASTLETVNQAAEMGEYDDISSIPDSALTHIDSLEDISSLPEVASEADLTQMEAVDLTETVSTGLDDFL